MRSFLAPHANSYDPNRIHPALNSFADECCSLLARLIAYVGTLALLAIVAIHLWDQLPDMVGAEPSATAGWSAASRAHPTLSQLDSIDKTIAYENVRRPEGGCCGVAMSAASADWLTAAENPRLRGAI